MDERGPQSNSTARDESHTVAQVVDRFDHDLYGHDEFREVLKPLLVTSAADSVGSSETASDARGTSSDAIASSTESIPPGAPAPVASVSDSRKKIIALQQIMAQQTMQMPARTRDAALADVHGVAELIKESDAIIDRCLAEMEYYLENIPSELTQAYRLANTIDASFASNVDFRLMFLRADLFNPRAAAERLALHFTLKLELFGKDLLARNLTVDDLDDETRNITTSGYFELLPMRDRAGRLIWLARIEGYNMLALMRAQFFCALVAVQGDIVTQTRGVVVVGYNVGPGAWVDFRIWRNISFCERASPMRIVAHHSLARGEEHAAFMHSLRFYQLPENRLRLLPQIDKSLEEYHRILRGYGIPIETFVAPGRSEQRMVERTHMQFLSQQLFLLRTKAYQNYSLGAPTHTSNSSAFTRYFVSEWNEASSSAAPHQAPHSSEILVPLTATKARKPVVEANKRSGNTGSTNEHRVQGLRKNDVVFGRGQSREHFGNVQVQEKVKENVDEYIKAGRSRKTEIAESVVKFVHESGGRFLKLAEDDIDEGFVSSTTNIGGYVEVPRKMAREKVARFFRRFQNSTK